MSEITRAQKKIYTECKKEIEKIFNKYREQGYFKFLADRKTCFASTTYPYIELDVSLLNDHDLPSGYFGFSFNMYKGISHYMGVLAVLLCSEDTICRAALEESKNKEKWVKFAKDFVEEINKATIFSRFMYRKAEEETYGYIEDFRYN